MRHSPHRLLPLLLLALLTGCRLDPSTTPIRITVPAETVSRPIRLVGDLPFVEVTVDGAGPYWFLVDTGSFTTLVDHHVERAARLPRSMRIGTVNGSTGPHSGLIRQVAIERLEIGPASFHEFEGLSFDLSPLAQQLGHPVDGVLGFPMMAGAIWVLDYPGERLQIARHGGAPPQGHAFRLLLSHGLPTLPARIGPRATRVLLDTGSGFGLELSAESLRAVTVQRAYDGHIVAVGLTGSAPVSIAQIEESFVLGPFRADRPWVGLDVEDDVVGGDLLRHFRVWIDRDGGTVHLHRGGAGPIELAPLSHPPATSGRP